MLLVVIMNVDIIGFVTAADTVGKMIDSVHDVRDHVCISYACLPACLCVCVCVDDSCSVRSSKSFIICNARRELYSSLCGVLECWYLAFRERLAQNAQQAAWNHARYLGLLQAALTGEEYVAIIRYITGHW